MGKTFSRLLWPLKQYNLESRAHKIISKEKPVAAPRHPTSEALLKDLPQDSRAEITGPTNKKLLDRLKDVYVTSEDPAQADGLAQESEDRPLPTSRDRNLPGIYGFHETDTLPYGKTSIRLAQEMIVKYQCDPKAANVDALAQQYNLDVEDTGNILKYFSALVAKTEVNEQNRIAMKDMQVITGGAEEKKSEPHAQYNQAKLEPNG